MVGTAAGRQQRRPFSDVLADDVTMDRRQFRLMLVGLMSVMLLSALDHTIVITALPMITGDLGGEHALAWVVTSYMLASSLSALWFGQLADRIGTKASLIIAVVIFTLGSALCGIAQDMPQLVALRVVQGIGAGGLMTLSQTIIASTVRERERGRYQGYVMSAFAGASIAGPLLGGTIADQVSWRLIFLINVPVGVVALALLCVSLQHTTVRALERDSGLSTVLLSITAVAFLVGVSQIGEPSVPGWLPPATIALSLALMAAFIWTERRVRRPLFASPALRSRLFATANGANLLANLSMMGAVILLPVYLQDLRGLGAAQTGALMLPQVGGWLGATVVCGIMISRTGLVRPFCLFGTVVTGLGLVALSTLSAATSYSLMVVIFVGFGIGQGFALQGLLVACQARIEPGEMGKATGFASFNRSVGSVLGVALSGVGLNVLQEHGMGLERAFGLTMLAACPLALVAFALCCLMPALHLSGGHTAATEQVPAGTAIGSQHDPCADRVGRPRPHPAPERP